MRSPWYHELPCSWLLARYTGADRRSLSAEMRDSAFNVLRYQCYTMLHPAADELPELIPSQRSASLIDDSRGRVLVNIGSTVTMENVLVMQRGLLASARLRFSVEPPTLKLQTEV